MVELLTTYSIGEVLVMLFVLILAIKGGWELLDFFKDKWSKALSREYSHLEQQEQLKQHYDRCKIQHQDIIDKYLTVEEKIDDLAKTLELQLTKIQQQIAVLTQSDMHDIKSFIVKEYHRFMERGWIDDFSLNTIMLRYEDYNREGGNSYISTLVDEIKQLPKQPPLS